MPMKTEDPADVFDAHNRNRWQTGWRQPAYDMVLTHTIETYIFDPYNRNRWPHNSRATTFYHAWPILLFALHAAFIPLLVIPKFLITTPILSNRRMHTF